ncbi:glycosyltransferase [Undibacterium sp.]|uniref:glycosyltransferase n=1 Tax=Undibacterium sp. TaxID=1914977 RepID=UPI0025D4DBAE|nr:glycosyltransferase [Undibacterium sp.]
MKIGMQTWGSHGDIRPFLALAQGLQAAGHEVTLVITCVDHAQYQSMDNEHGVKIIMVASPVIADPAEGAQAALRIFNTRNAVRQLKLICSTLFAPAEAAMLAAAQALCQESDVLIGHFFLHPLQIAAEKSKKPYMTVMFVHSLIATKFLPPLGFPALGQWGNRFGWCLVKTTLQLQLGKYPNRLRQQLGMPAGPDLLSKVWSSEQLTLIGVSPTIAVRQPDWPAHVQVCGFLDMPNLALEGQLSGDMQHFLQAGDAPVYMTFGSMMVKDLGSQSQSLQLLTAAAKLAGCRAIIQADLWQECGYTNSANILYVSAAPHHLVFPHCQAVLHHGGAGTSHSATLACKPSIVVAHLDEQEFWGKQLQDLGIGGKPLRRRSLTAAKLAQQILSVLNTPQMAQQAEKMARTMQAENGVAAAVKLINAQCAAIKA